jgi:hypothetical protein
VAAAEAGGAARAETGAQKIAGQKAGGANGGAREREATAFSAAAAVDRERVVVDITNTTDTFGRTPVRAVESCHLIRWLCSLPTFFFFFSFH